MHFLLVVGRKLSNVLSSYMSTVQFLNLLLCSFVLHCDGVQLQTVHMDCERESLHGWHCLVQLCLLCIL